MSAEPRRVVLLSAADAMAAHHAPGHPERPARLTVAADGVRDGAAASGAALVEPTVVGADDATIGRVHDPRYVEALDAAEAGGGGMLDPDTYLVRGSMSAARHAAGATVAAALSACRGEAEVAFAVVRPPGHHAAAARGAGFCLLNNVVIAVAALRAAGLADRVAIVDFDVHHGDGTQSLLDADADACFASTHQSPFYPGTGSVAERGIGAAAGTKHNRPLPAGSGDEVFVAAWVDELLPAIAAFEPQAILVSAGYDAHAADPMAGLAVTEAGYRLVAHRLGALASDLGLPGVALTLEGGYDLGALRRSVSATVEGLLDGLADPGSSGRGLYSTPPWQGRGT